MSKTIRVSDNVFQRLQDLQFKRETYSQVIDRCIAAVEIIRTVPLERDREFKQGHVLARGE